MYDDLAEHYHLIYPDWEASIGRQASCLDKLICSRWECRSIHDCACGIGTQVLGLAALGYQCSGTDLSPQAVARARREASARGLDIPLEVLDMRRIATWPERVDVAICVDNCITHLKDEADILETYRGCRSIARRGILITVRDYDQVDRSRTFLPLGHSQKEGVLNFYFQRWTFGPDNSYDADLYLVTDQADGGQPPAVRRFRTRYFLHQTRRLADLMRQAGFTDVTVIKDAESFYQPVIIGSVIE